MSDVVVTQEDERAAATLLGFTEWRDAQLWSNAVAGDAIVIAKAFARHRIAARKQALEEAAQWLIDDGTRLDYDAEPAGKEHPFWWAADRIRKLGETK